MKKINEIGRSMIEMLAVLGIIGVLSAGGVAGYGKAINKYRIHTAVSYITDAIIEYQLFLKRNPTSYPTDTDKMAQTALDYGLLSTCKIANSELAGSSYQVCRISLGEVYPRFFITTDSTEIYQTYMLYVSFTSNKTQACIDFLNQRWDQIVPQKFWRRGKLWLTSNHGDRMVYSSTVNHLNLTDIGSLCSELCETEALYCTVVFDFTTLGR